MQTSEMAWTSFTNGSPQTSATSSYGNPVVSGGGQVDRDRTRKMSLIKISGKWASAGTRLKRLRRTGGTGGIVSPNVSSTRDEPGTRNGRWLGDSKGIWAAI